MRATVEADGFVTETDAEGALIVWSQWLCRCGPSGCAGRGRWKGILVPFSFTIVLFIACRQRTLEGNMNALLVEFASASASSSHRGPVTRSLSPRVQVPHSSA